MMTEVLERTINKIAYLEIKLKRLEHTGEQQNLDSILDEFIERQEIDKVSEFDDVSLLETRHGDFAIINRARTYSYTLERNDSFDDSTNSIIGLETDLKNLPQNISNFDKKQKIFDEFNFECVVAKIKNVGINPTALCTETLIKILIKMDIAMDNILIYPNNHDYGEMFFRAEFLKAYEINLHKICKCPDDDVFYLKQLDENRKDKFYQITNDIHPDNIDTFMWRYKGFGNLIEIGLAVVSKTLNRENHIMKALKLLWYAPVFLLSQKRRQSQYKLFISSGDLPLILKIAKASGNSVSKFVFYFINPFIRFHKKIYIPKNYSKLTLKNLNKGMEDFMLKHDDDDEDEPELHRKFVKRLRCAQSFNVRLENKLDTNTENFKYRNSKELIMLRIASPFYIELNNDSSIERSPPKECDAVLIHIHGGGFISQSSSQHQVYLRKWSKELNIPVLMLSYTLAPEAEYPGALNDCWQSYMWIIDNMENALGIKPKKILLSGDSAGGNLATSLTGLAICKGVRVPDALFPLYPALLLSNSNFSPSRLFVFDDHLLNNLLISGCISSYCRDLVPEEHPFMCPLLFPEKVFVRFPITRLSLAGLDPLHDDGYRLGYKLGTLNKDVRVIDNKFLFHGFLNFGLVPLIGGECTKAINTVREMMKEIIDA